ncbi:MAG TPA: peptidase M50 [Ruminococcaceae bacterium]|jgi:stage IV sporulation protein FB|nr:peptidase M50 [Oscillospiraceae bacterium]
MCFTVFGCRVKIRFWFVALITLSLLIDRTGIAGVGLLATAFHESGHFAAIALFHFPPEQVCMSLFGIEIQEKKGSRRTYGQDAGVALAGPAANLLAFAVCWGVFLLTSSLYLANLAAANLLLALLNALPVGPLDGGQALYSFLCRSREAERSEKIVEVVSFFVILPIAILGFFILLRSRYNFSLLIVSGYLMLMLLLKKGRYF